MVEIERIHTHLIGALALVHAAPSTRRQRRLIGALRGYTEARRYPLNREHPGELLPSFVDASGTRCAMAHLVERHGGADIVARVAREANHAWVRELAADADFRSWLATWGLSVAEAARIQPGYCWSSAQCVCVNTNGAKTVLEATIVAGDAGAYVARVDKVHGVKDREAAGDTVPFTAPYGERERPLDGRKLLVVPYVLPSGERRFAQKEVDARGNVTCDVFGKKTPPVPMALAVRAVLSKSCEATLTAVDGNYGRDHCGGMGFSLNLGGLIATSAVGAILFVRTRRARDQKVK